MQKRTLKIVSLVLSLSFLLLSSGCKKQDSGPGKATVYTADPHRWSLLIDGKDYGLIGVAVQEPVCGDKLFQVVTLSSGVHTFDAKSLDGLAWGSPKKINIQENECVTVKLP